MSKITTFLTFNDRAEEAVSFYTSIFKSSKVVSVTRYGDAGPGKKGDFMSAIFELNGQTFYALNGGPPFTFAMGTSLFVSCDTQAEIDEYWEKLSAGGGAPLECGWLRDKFGMFWQVVPANVFDLLNDKDPEKAARVMGALMKMTKLDKKALEAAHAGK